MGSSLDGQAVRRLGVVAALILLNGPPASGKSTVAERLVAMRPLALDLDIDLIRGQLGRWLDQPADAGVAARALALSMMDTHLGAGHDVVVPQFLARPDFIEELEQAAARAGAIFVELALELSRSDAVAAFESRRRQPTRSTHRAATDVVDRATSSDPVGEMYDALQLLLAQRGPVRRVEVVRGDIDQTLEALLRVLSDSGIVWSNPPDDGACNRSSGDSDVRVTRWNGVGEI